MIRAKDARKIMETEGKPYEVFLRSGALQGFIITGQAEPIKDARKEDGSPYDPSDDEAPIEFVIRISRGKKQHHEFRSAESYADVMEKAAAAVRFTPETFRATLTRTLQETGLPKWHRFYSAVKLLKQLARENGYGDSIPIVDRMERPVISFLYGRVELDRIEREMFTGGYFNKDGQAVQDDGPVEVEEPQEAGEATAAEQPAQEEQQTTEGEPK